MSNTASTPPDSIIPRVLLTAGEPAGIGPDIIVQISRYDFPAELTVVADPDLLLQRAEALNLPLTLNEATQAGEAGYHTPGRLNILPSTTVNKVVLGKTDTANVPYVLETIQRSTRGCLDGAFHAMVTAPVNKAVINAAGIPFTGHTEYIAEICDSRLPVMMLMNNKLRVALVTTHLPITEVASALSRELIVDVIRIVHESLKNYLVEGDPKLLICGLNPHAGESGHLGKEEDDIIIPALTQLRAEGVVVKGPVPADTAFTPDSLLAIDAVICMYHDQGLPVLKAQAFGEVVNLTLGLPIIRTSVDHGTALSLAGTGKARENSMIAAIHCAIGLTKRRNRD